jgi:hypothetical protein
MVQAMHCGKLDLGAWLRRQALLWRHWLSMVTGMPQIYLFILNIRHH